ncbi:unnamed protein product [Anisakis simplex]|uniref:Uncharacterized protein n=1 Tax=Anisakis simplex TaxID=6269 RepID=A0A0M3J5I4_ANISI|nr:unnamed protein product [Anisakis simplex]
MEQMPPEVQVQTARRAAVVRREGTNTAREFQFMNRSNDHNDDNNNKNGNLARGCALMTRVVDKIFPPEPGHETVPPCGAQ